MSDASHEITKRPFCGEPGHARFTCLSHPSIGRSPMSCRSVIVAAVKQTLPYFSYFRFPDLVVYVRETYSAPRRMTTRWVGSRQTTGFGFTDSARERPIVLAPSIDWRLDRPFTRALTNPNARYAIYVVTMCTNRLPCGDGSPRASQRYVHKWERIRRRR